MITIGELESESLGLFAQPTVDPQQAADGCGKGDSGVVLKMPDDTLGADHRESHAYEHLRHELRQLAKRGVKHVKVRNFGDDAAAHSNTKALGTYLRKYYPGVDDDSGNYKHFPGRSDRQNESANWRPCP